MNRGYVVGCSVIVAAAALGYWIFSDQLPSHRPLPPTLAPNQENGGATTDQLETYSSRTTGDVIDLARVYDPTGEELDLHNLLHGQLVAELIVAPREAGAELGPSPREAEWELLHAPRLVMGELSEAAEEASSPRKSTQCIPGPFAWAVAGCVANWLNQWSPLRGINLPIE